jgi:signal transduction histidine kinase
MAIMQTLMSSQDLDRPDDPDPSALEGFARQVAHDLRNLINNLGLSLQQVELRVDDGDAPTARALERMRQNLENIERLAEEIVIRARERSAS